MLICASPEIVHHTTHNCMVKLLKILQTHSQFTFSGLVIDLQVFSFMKKISSGKVYFLTVKQMYGIKFEQLLWADLQATWEGSQLMCKPCACQCYLNSW